MLKYNPRVQFGRESLRPFCREQVDECHTPNEGVKSRVCPIKRPRDFNLQHANVALIKSRTAMVVHIYSRCALAAARISNRNIINKWMLKYTFTIGEMCRLIKPVSSRRAAARILSRRAVNIVNEHFSWFKISIYSIEITPPMCVCVCMQHCCSVPRPEHTHTHAGCCFSACDVMANARDTKQSPICHAEIQSIFRVFAPCSRLFMAHFTAQPSMLGVVTIALLPWWVERVMPQLDTMKREEKERGAPLHFQRDTLSLITADEIIL